MSDKSETELQQNIKTSLDVLNKLLSAYPDLQTTLAKALRFVLDTTNRKGGMIIIQGPDDSKPLFFVLDQPASDWAEQIEDEGSMLRDVLPDLDSTRRVSDN